MEYYPATKKNKIMPFVATWMDLEIKKKDKYNIISITCGILKKKKKRTNELTNRNRLTDLEK